MSYVPRTERNRDIGTSSTTTVGYVPRSERTKIETASSSTSSYVPRSERTKTETACSTSAYVPRREREKEDTSSRAERLKKELDSTPTTSTYVSKYTKTDTSSSNASYTPSTSTTSYTSSYVSRSERETKTDDGGSRYKPSYTSTYQPKDYSAAKPYEGRSGTSSLIGGSSGKGGAIEKPKKQIEHERQLEKIKKDFEGDFKKKSLINLERKQRDWDRLWKEEEKRERDNERKKDYWKKKIERDEEDHKNAFEQLKTQVAEKEQTRMNREKDSEDRFNERVQKNIANNIVKKEQKHAQWQSKMDKRYARNKISDEKRAKRLKDRGIARNEHLQNEKQDANARRQRRREHFLLSYQSTWSELAVSEAAENQSASGYVAPELEAATVGAFQSGDTRHLDNEGKDTTKTVVKKTDAQLKAEELEKELESKAKADLEADLMDDTDELMKALDDDSSSPNATATTKASNEPSMTDEEREELLLDLEDQLDNLVTVELKKVQKKFDDATDLLADIDKDDVEMKEEAELELLDAEEELVNVEDKIKKLKIRIKELSG